jgi:prepilin-type processing-associated H-X9-DG protein
MYRGDNNGCMIGKANTVPGSGDEWVNTLKGSYGTASSTNGISVIMCPSVIPCADLAAAEVNGAYGTAATPWVDDTGIDLTQSSYTVNGWLYDSTDTYSETVPKDRFDKEANVAKTSLCPVFGEGIWIDTWPMEEDSLAKYAPVNLYTGNDDNNATGGGGMGRYLIDRHGGVAPAQAPRYVPTGGLQLGAMNLGMFDGHVETVPLRNLWQYYWHLNWTNGSNLW